MNLKTHCITGRQRKKDKFKDQLYYRQTEGKR